MYKLFDYQNELIDKTRKEQTSGNKNVLIVSPAGSGKSVVISEIARLAAAKGGFVLFLVHRQELVNQIKRSFKNNEVDEDNYLVTTIGTAANHLDIMRKPALIITDETHHALANTYQKIYKYFQDVPRLGFTATPWRMNGKGFKSVYDTMVLGKSVQWLIDHDHLAPETIYAPVSIIDPTKLSNGSTRDYTDNEISQAIKKGQLGSVVDSYQKFGKNGQAILYAHNREYSEKFAAEFTAAGISAVHVDSKTPQKQRNQIMSDFKSGKIKVMCNVDLVSEGFDVPDCSVVILCRPTKSLVLYIQQSMRSMRYMPNKKAVIIDHVGNFRRFGYPSDDRSWSIEDREKVAKKTDPDTIYSCEECFGVFREWDNGHCPYCGAPKPDYMIAAEQAEAKQIEDEIARVEKAKKSLKEARTISEIFDIAKARENVKRPLPFAIKYADNVGIKYSRRDIQNIINVEGYARGYLFQLQKIMRKRF